MQTVFPNKRKEITVCYIRSSKASSMCREKSLGQQQPFAFKSPWAQLCCRSTQRPRWWPGTHHTWHRRGQERGTALVGGTGDPNRRQKGAGQRASPEASAGCRTKKLIFWLKSQGPYTTIACLWVTVRVWNSKCLFPFLKSYGQEET